MTKKKKMSLTNGYTNKKRRKEILFGSPAETWSDFNRKVIKLINCKCGRSIYDHPEVRIGDHYVSIPYHGALCPFLLLKE